MGAKALLEDKLQRHSSCLSKPETPVEPGTEVISLVWAQVGLVILHFINNDIASGEITVYTPISPGYDITSAFTHCLSSSPSLISRVCLLSLFICRPH
jgi:hypothetical protein